MPRLDGHLHYSVEDQCPRTTVRLHLPSEYNNYLRTSEFKLTMSESLHIGQNQIGNSFGGAFDEFESGVVQPFQLFLRNVFREFNVAVMLHNFSNASIGIAMHVRQSRSLQHSYPSIPEGLETIPADGPDANVHSPSTSQSVDIVPLADEPVLSLPGLPVTSPSVSVIQTLSFMPPGLTQTAIVASSSHPANATPVSPSNVPPDEMLETTVDPTTSGLVVTPRLSRVSQGGVFTSPSIWKHHFRDNDNGDDTSVVPVATPISQGGPFAIPSIQNRLSRNENDDNAFLAPVTAPESIQPLKDARRPSEGDTSADAGEPLATPLLTCSPPGTNPMIAIEPPTTPSPIHLLSDNSLTLNAGTNSAPMTAVPAPSIASATDNTPAPTATSRRRSSAKTVDTPEICVHPRARKLTAAGELLVQTKAVQAERAERAKAKKSGSAKSTKEAKGERTKSTRGRKRGGKA